MDNKYHDQLLDRWTIVTDQGLEREVWNAVVEEGIGKRIGSKRDLETLLKEFHNDRISLEKLHKIDIFCKEVCRYIWILKRRLLRNQSDKKIIDDISKMKTDFNATKFHLERIITNGPSFLGELYPSIDEIDARDGGKEDYLHTYSKCVGDACAALEYLKKVQAVLETREKAVKPSPGRPGADRHGFVRALANTYRRWIGRPTTYDDGPFVEVVRIALSAAGLPADDPSRAVRAALKEHSPTK